MIQLAIFSTHKVVHRGQIAHKSTTFSHSLSLSAAISDLIGSENRKEAARNCCKSDIHPTAERPCKQLWFLSQLGVRKQQRDYFSTVIPRG